MDTLANAIRKIATGISVPEAYKVRERAMSPSHDDDVPDYVRDRRDPKTPGGKPEKWDAQKKTWKGWKPITDLLRDQSGRIRFSGKEEVQMTHNGKYVWKKTQKGDAKTLMFKSPETGKEFHVSP